ncbi:unnamed protein product [Protopolystoma xenopodis]|uniref:Uncharacterized protein n=1 Tax=Protopolystoma xenopodis TaxID=117903 RepID=A0A3S5A690_9PLAT|nr:unnamed protein product [Protopolystoma xenopodis]
MASQGVSAVVFRWDQPSISLPHTLTLLVTSLSSQGSQSPSLSNLTDNHRTLPATNNSSEAFGDDVWSPNPKSPALSLVSMTQKATASVDEARLQDYARRSHFLFTLHIYQYRMKPAGSDTEGIHCLPHLFIASFSS